MTIRLVTDSGACLPAQWVERFGITVVELHLLTERDETVGTSGPGPEELREIYSRLLEDPDCTGIVSVHMSAALSRTWESAADAANGFGGRVLVVNSLGAGMHAGAGVAQSAWHAEQGMGLSAVYDLANRLTRASRTLVSVVSLDPLRRGGRLGTAIAVVGNALAMKPVLELVDGRVVVAARTRTLTKAHNRMRALLRESVDDRDVLIAVQHYGAPERAAELADEIRKETAHPERVCIAEIDEVVGWHLGEGAVAVSVTPLETDDFPIPVTHPQAES